jgi:phosphoglucosamine mutase
MLNKDTVVPTIMSNSGFFKSLEKLGIKTEQTTVGDRFVYECMQANDYSLGGEQSGHIIIKKYATTGDGLLTAIMLAEEVCDTKKSLGALTDGLVVYPQVCVNVKVTSKDAVFEDEAVQAEFAKVQALIGDDGRALLRKSGTEPKIRVMIEALSEELCKEYADMIVKVILERGYGA